MVHLVIERASEREMMKSLWKVYEDLVRRNHYTSHQCFKFENYDFSTIASLSNIEYNRYDICHLLPMIALTRHNIDCLLYLQAWKLISRAFTRSTALSMARLLLNKGSTSL